MWTRKETNWKIFCNIFIISIHSRMCCHLINPLSKLNHEISKDECKAAKCWWTWLTFCTKNYQLRSPSNQMENMKGNHWTKDFKIRLCPMWVVMTYAVLIPHKCINIYIANKHVIDILVTIRLTDYYLYFTK